MIVSSKIIIKSYHKYFKELDNLCFLSKNLYNSALYTIKQEYKFSKKYLNNFDVDKLFTKNKQKDFYAIYTQASKQTLKLLNNNFKSFFAKRKQGLKAKLPKYLDKINGRFSYILPGSSIHKLPLKNAIISLPKVNAKFNAKINNHLTITNINQIKEIRIIPKNGYIQVEIVYDIPESILKQDNQRYVSIDLGINNLATITSNVTKPIIINGKPLKSINQYYNKKKAELQNKLPKGIYTSNKIKNLSLKRENKISDYLHKSSKYIVNHLVFNNINTLILGYNQGWKQETNLGKINNQNFVNIPFYKFKEMLKYKCKLAGINFIETEESYTSKCSFLDNEDVCKHDVYLGKRIYRGLFKSANGKIINADVNASLNIMKKVNVAKKLNIKFNDLVEVCGIPKKINI